MQDISVIILTYNEELHIERAILNARKFAKEIFVVDSYSTDRTTEIAEGMGGVVIQHEFAYHAEQLNWAIKNLPIKTEWIFRLDADEYLSDDLIAEIGATIANSQPEEGINGYTAPREMVFLGRHIKHGIIPMIILRLFRNGYAYVEDKRMDEHIVLSEGAVGELKHPFFDDNMNGLSAWTEKHNGYSTKEALDLLATEYDVGIGQQSVANFGNHSVQIRRMKLRYAKLPLFWRASALFVYRYIFRLGFLDGKEGFLWHFLQGFWYRCLADAKVYEIKKNCGFDDSRIRDFIEKLLK